MAIYYMRERVVWCLLSFGRFERRYFNELSSDIFRKYNQLIFIHSIPPKFIYNIIHVDNYLYNIAIKHPSHYQVSHMTLTQVRTLTLK